VRGERSESKARERGERERRPFIDGWGGRSMCGRETHGGLSCPLERESWGMGAPA